MSRYDDYIKENGKIVRLTCQANTVTNGEDIPEELRKSVIRKIIEAEGSLEVKDSPVDINHPNVLLVDCIQVSTGFNNNDHFFDSQELWTARNTPLFQIADWMHENKFPIGCIIETMPKDRQGNELNAADVQIDANTEFDLHNKIVVWAYRFPDVAERIMEMHARNELFVSMECTFEDFDFAVESADGISIVQRNAETDFLTDNLKIFGGSGLYKNQRVGILLKGISFLGVGFVDNPANPRSEITDIAAKEDKNMDIDAALTHNNKLADREPAWGQVDNKKLPRNAFADMGEEDNVSSWGYPHHWVQNGGAPDEDGRYTTGNMFLHRGGLGVASAAAEGARSGKKAKAIVIRHLNAHRRKLGLELIGGVEDQEKFQEKTEKIGIIENKDGEFGVSISVDAIKEIMGKVVKSGKGDDNMDLQSATEKIAALEAEVKSFKEQDTIKEIESIKTESEELRAKVAELEKTIEDLGKAAEEKDTAISAEKDRADSAESKLAEIEAERLFETRKAKIEGLEIEISDDELRAMSEEVFEASIRFAPKKKEDDAEADAKDKQDDKEDVKAETAASEVENAKAEKDKEAEAANSDKIDEGKASKPCEALASIINQ